MPTALVKSEIEILEPLLNFTLAKTSFRYPLLPGNKNILLVLV